MQTVLVPKQGDSESAHLFAACFDAGTSKPVGLSIEVRTLKGKRVANITDLKWRVINPSDLLPAKERVQFYTEVEAKRLTPGTAYQARLRVGRRVLSSAEFSTLPRKLYPKKPFNVLLGSCFHRDEDPEGQAGAAVHALSAADRPHVKLLAGDQVYLDMPAKRFIVAKPPAELAALHLETYRQTWCQSPGRGKRRGFGAILRRGLTWSIADDHEYWNNYPQATQYLGNTMTPKGRAVWQGISRSLFDIFQAPAGTNGGQPSRFDVDRLSFLTLDTRYNRGKKTFLSKTQFDELEEWCEHVTGEGQLGVLAISQPLFDGSKAGQKVFDRNLASLRSSYRRLIKMLDRCPQPILVLSGDVHFGRVSVVKRADGSLHRAEVLSSPLQHLMGKVSNEKKAPGKFPAHKVPGVADRRVRTAETTTGKNALFRGDQFATLAFTDDGHTVSVRVRHWSADKQNKMLGETSLRFVPGGS